MTKINRFNYKKSSFCTQRYLLIYKPKNVKTKAKIAPNKKEEEEERKKEKEKKKMTTTTTTTTTTGMARLWSLR